MRSSHPLHSWTTSAGLPKKTMKPRKAQKKTLMGLKHLNSFVPKYNVFQSFLSTSSGLRYRQLLRGGGESAQNDLRRVIKENKSKKNVFVPIASVPMWLKLVTIVVYGHQVQALLDSRTVPNLLSTDLATKIGIEVEESVKKIAVAHGENSETLVSVTGLPIAFDKIQYPLISSSWVIHHLMWLSDF